MKNRVNTFMHRILHLLINQSLRLHSLWWRQIDSRMRDGNAIRMKPDAQDPSICAFLRLLNPSTKISHYLITATEFDNYFYQSREYKIIHLLFNSVLHLSRWSPLHELVSKVSEKRCQGKHRRRDKYTNKVHEGVQKISKHFDFEIPRKYNCHEKSIKLIDLKLFW